MLPRLRRARDLTTPAARRRLHLQNHAQPPADS